MSIDSDHLMIPLSMNNGASSINPNPLITLQTRLFISSKIQDFMTGYCVYFGYSVYFVYID
jgi:hypothetical protein